jgi:IclR family acetate operon transcriptional repressor
MKTDSSVAVGSVSPSEGSTSPQLLERTFSVLALFAGEKTQWTTTEIGQQVGLPVPTAHRIVVALSTHGYLVRDPSSKRFRLGPAAIALGRAATTANDLPTVASAFLPKLMLATEETSLLTVPTVGNDSSVCLLRFESPHPLRLSVEPGRNLPLHAGASQKAILAYLPEVDRQRIAHGPLEQFCSSTLVTPDALLSEIESIRTRGWAYSIEETNPGVWGVAIALLNSSGFAVAAVGVAGPQVRLSRDVVKSSVEATRQVVEEMATALGLTSSCTSTAVPARLALRGSR